MYSQGVRCNRHPCGHIFCSFITSSPMHHEQEAATWWWNGHCLDYNITVIIYLCTATELVKSLHFTLMPRNLKLGTQFLDSENVQCNLKIAQIWIAWNIRMLHTGQASVDTDGINRRKHTYRLCAIQCANHYNHWTELKRQVCKYTVLFVIVVATEEVERLWFLSPTCWETSLSTCKHFFFIIFTMRQETFGFWWKCDFTVRRTNIMTWRHTDTAHILHIYVGFTQTHCKYHYEPQHYSPSIWQ